jgi:diguanylate cyclase (GGDEF)-like protein
MQKEEIFRFDTEFAPAERLGHAGLLRQHQAWSEQVPTLLISNAIPDLLLILNEYCQSVYSNNLYQQFGGFTNVEDYLGLRPGELVGCKHACESQGGCGTTSSCAVCGTIRAILIRMSGKSDVEECLIERENGLSPLNFRIRTTPVELNHEKFTIFSVQDISLEKENAHLLDEVQKLAIIDPLTEIYNRRIFFEVANREITRSIRYHNPFSVIMIDLDRFKEVNDTYGHPAGDAVIKEVVRLIQLNLREIDTFARYGGDEFIILLPETGLVGGQKVADRIMLVGDKSVYLYKDFEIPIPFSAGVAEFTFELDRDIDDVISRADQDLYRVKHARRELKID